VEFINNMTHEFQTPISTISVAGETLTKEKIKGDPKRLERFRAVILEETARMRKQVEKILDFAALEKGDIELRFEPVDLHDLIRQIAENWDIQIDKSAGTLDLDLKAGNDRIMGDAFHLENVLNNLIDNAVKYTHGKPEIRIATENGDGVLRVCVADKGIGIPKEAMKFVFDKYYRVPQGTVHEVKGFGLGLSYVKSVMDKHRGRITVESEPGKGTIVRLDLPLAGGD
jgi:two-component system, OmpR family, phosphate regulon sensor histidine kinase PhoR